MGTVQISRKKVVDGPNMDVAQMEKHLCLTKKELIVQDIIHYKDMFVVTVVELFLHREKLLGVLPIVSVLKVIKMKNVKLEATRTVIVFVMMMLIVELSHLSNSIQK